jgi:glycine C-acetyltransferase
MATPTLARQSADRLNLLRLHTRTIREGFDTPNQFGHLRYACDSKTTNRLRPSEVRVCRTWEPETAAGRAPMRIFSPYQDRPEWQNRRPNPGGAESVEMPMKAEFLERLARQTDELRNAGLYKPERVLGSPQQATVRVVGGSEVINLCANNYLGLANHGALREAARLALDRYGYGMASVRFICGTHAIHKDLEDRLSRFLGTDDTILYSSCFDANGGLFETLLDENDAVISDALNHASIIDGIRLCKAQRLRYANNDLDELEARLKEASRCRVRLIATDGVFSMDGVIARLREICDLADRYDALVMVDDSHATGFVGATGRGTHELRGVVERVDILTGTLGKALGGGSGGYTAGRKEIVGWLRQRSRPYLFSNSIPPFIAAASLRALDLLEADDTLRARLWQNAGYFRERMTATGFTLTAGEHPIIPVMLGDAKLASEFAQRLLTHGVYAIGFSYPVVPHGKARIRTQMSAAHTQEQLDQAVTAFTTVGKELGVIGRR